LKRAYAKRGAVHKRKPSERRAAAPDPDWLVQLPLDREELLGLMQDSLEGLAVEPGLLVATAILEDEVARLCGARVGLCVPSDSSGVSGFARYIGQRFTASEALRHGRQIKDRMD
jgi:hypothetical protein